MSSELSKSSLDANETTPGMPSEATARPAEHRKHSFGQHEPSGTLLLRRRIVWGAGLILLIALAAIPIWHGIRRAAPEASTAATHPALPSVAVAKVVRCELFNEVPYPAEFRPYQEVELHAKVSGYVNEMKVDFGDRVKAGQLLATLEVPELLAQLTNAIAVQRRAEAEYQAAHTNYLRMNAVAKQNPNLVAQQDLDNAQAKDGTTDAAVAAAKAEVDRYQTLAGYTRITAPFDGVITKRYVDPGALIQAGTASDTQSLPVVRVSDNYRLRLDFPVEVKYVKDVHLAAPVDVLVESLGDKVFSGVITRTTDKVEKDTRTMMTEIEVDNPNLELVPGMYATATLKVQQRAGVLSIPIDALSGQKTSGHSLKGGSQKATVYIVNANNEVEARTITLGLETPTRFEVTSGLKEGELVMTAGLTMVQPGQKVSPVLGPSLAEQMEQPTVRTDN